MNAAVDAATTQRATSRRAWVTVAAGVAVFLALGSGLIIAGTWILEHATVERNATARVISGDEALWRKSPDDEWTIFNGDISISEGDEISTELGTVVWITLFDGSTLEVTEHSYVHFERLRESRFSDAARQVKVALHQGSIYGAMAPVTEYDYGELEIVTDAAGILLRAERDVPLNPSPSFVVETTSDETSITRTRAASFRGQVAVRTDAEEFLLTGPEQIEFEGTVLTARGSTISSEIIVDGSFTHGLEAWERTYSAEQREPQDRAGVSAVEQVDDDTASTALHIHRPDSEVWARTGVAQRIDRTLRLPADLTLSFDVLLEHQGPPVDGRSTVPLAIELNYTDVTGQDRGWTTAFTIRREDGVIDADAVTTVRPGEWTKVLVDLENLEPIPKILRTLVVYASGGGYDSYLANLSLTTSEGSANP